jgi:putative glycosyl hydrolase-like family 6 (GHL6) protein
MRHLILLALLSVLPVCPQSKRSVDEPMPPRQVHLDFHTSEQIPDIGARFSKENFQQALKLARLNSINIFAKGHHSMSYYPTKVGTMHPNLDFDLLGAEIAACHEIGVECPIYFTVGWSSNDAEEHPEWCAREKDGAFSVSNYDLLSKPDDPKPYTSWKLLCPSGDYHDHVMAQVDEIVTNYDVDGFFFDIYQIEHACYCHNCRRRMKADGVDIEDREAVIGNFARQYRDHMEDLRGLIAKHHPEATVFFNGTTKTARPWNFEYKLYGFNTHQDLEDLPTTWGGYDKLPMHAKLHLELGWPVTAMSGKFHKAWGEFGGFKHPDALRYEAAAMIAFGAACNIGDQMHPSGEMDLETYRLIGEAFEYVEQIEDYGLPGIPYSKLGLWFTNDFEADDGVASLLLDIHYDFRIANEENLSAFDTVVIGSARSLTPAQGAALDQFVGRGGKLLVIERGALLAGEDRLALDIGASYIGAANYRMDYTIVGPSLTEDMVTTPFLNYNSGLRVRPGQGTEVLARIREPYFDRTYASYSSHRDTPYRLEDAVHPAVTREGNVVYLAHALDRQYKTHGLRLHRQLFQNALDLIYTEPTLTTDLPSTARVSLLHQPARNRYVAHLLYAPPIHRGEVESIEDMPPLYEVPVELRVPQTVKKAYTIPGKNELEITAADGSAKVTVPKFQMHTAVVFEY